MSSTESEVSYDDGEAPDSGAGSSQTALNVLRYLGAELTQHPEQVLVQEQFEAPNRIRLTLSVDKADMGRVIGRHGKIASAIRAVVRAAGAKDGFDASVEIQERVN